MVDFPYIKNYKIYNSLDPCTNLYLKQKWDKASYETCVKRVLLAKSTIDDLPPYSYKHHSQLRNKENKLKNENKREIIYLSQYDYNLKRAVQEQYEKDLLDKTNKNLLSKIRYMSKESNYSREKLLKENEENKRILKNLSKFKPHNNDDKKKKTTKTLAKTASTKSIVNDKDVQSILNKSESSASIKSTSSKKTVTWDMNIRPKSAYERSNSNYSLKLSKKSFNTNKKANNEKYAKKNNENDNNSIDNSSISSCGNTSGKTNSNSKSNKTQTTTTSSSSENQIKSRNKYPDYKLYNKKMDKLYEMPIKPEMTSLLKALVNEKEIKENEMKIKETKDKIFGEIELIQNRKSLKELELSY
jgi:hypothetical protein